MTFFLAGRLTLVVPLLLVSLTFFSFVLLSPSHATSHPRIHKRSVVHALEQRKATVTTEITTTVFTTSSVTLSESPAGVSPSTSSRTHTHHHQHSTFTSSSTLPPSPLSESSSSESSSSSSSHTGSRTHSSSSSTSSSSSFAEIVPSSTGASTLILVPTPLSPTPATTLAIADDPLTRTSASPTSIAQVLPSSTPSATSIEAASTSFWSNKGAVGGVFTVVGLIIAGIIGLFLFTYVKRVKKNRSRRYDEELFSSFFDRTGHSRNGSSPGPESLNHPAIDPFAAGEVVQVPGSAASLHHGFGGTAVGPSSPGGKIGHGGYSSDDGHSSHGHSSSMHHGFSGISYYAGLSESRANLAISELPSSSQLPKSAPLSVSSPKSHLEDPFSNAAALPLSANTVSSTHTVPSPFLGAGQANNGRQMDSDASYYADQMHSYYYGAGATAPPVPRSFGQAF